MLVVLDHVLLSTLTMMSPGQRFACFTCLPFPSNGPPLNF
jgi:hypothetical protein